MHGPAFWEKARNFFGAHRKALLRIFYAVMLLSVAFVAYRELSSISLFTVKEIFSRQRPDVLVGVMLLGIFAFMATGVYDVFARRHFGVDISVKNALTIGWIAQAFNNFAGLGGLTGGTLRTKHYTSRGIDTKKALNLTMSVWAANLLGLFAIILATLPIALRWEGSALIISLVGCLYLPFYFFGQHIRLGRINLGKSFLSHQNFAQKCQMLLASVVDWAAAAVFFWICIRLFAPDAHFMFSLFVYSAATVIGLLSMLPAGIGTFDLAVLTFFANHSIDASELFLGVLLFRISYYVVPWLLALLLSTTEFLDAHRELENARRRGGMIHNVLWFYTALGGVLLILSTVTSEKFLRSIHLYGFLSADIRNATALTSIAIGTVLIVLAYGLKQRVRHVYFIAVGLLAVGVLSSLREGMEYKDAAILLLFAVLLLASRDHFQNEPKKPTKAQLIKATALTLLIPLILLSLRIWAIHAKTVYIRSVSPNHRLLQLAFCLFAISVIVTTIIFSHSQKLDFVAPTHGEIDEFHNFLLSHDGNNYSYLYGLGDKQIFYNSAHTVAFLYRPHRGSLLVLGDPIGVGDDFPAAVDELLTFADDHNMSIAFYQIANRYLPLVVEEGLQIVKIGEDATIELDSYSNVGNSGKIFRRMRNRMAQNGTFFELIYPPFSDSLIKELKEVSDSWLGEREEMGYSLGFFDPDYLSNGPVAVVRSKERIEGFANVVFFNKETVSFDLMRFRTDSPGGTMDGILVSLIEWAKEVGFKEFNLGMAPLSNVGRKRHSHGAELVVRYVHDFGDRIYNFHGLRAYKEKFRPRWDSRYLVYSSKKSLPSLLLALLEIINKPTDHDSDDCRRSRELFAACRNSSLHFTDPDAENPPETESGACGPKSAVSGAKPKPKAKTKSKPGPEEKPKKENKRDSAPHGVATTTSGDSEDKVGV